MEFYETCHCPPFKKLSKRDDQLSSKDMHVDVVVDIVNVATCSIEIFDNEQAVDI